MTDNVLRTAERFWSYVDKDGSCWIWLGFISPEGYGRFQVASRTGYQAHRVSWMLRHGQIPEGMELDHLCRIRSCVNPDHLEAVSHRVNTIRGIGPSAVNYAKTHCNNGHEFTVENTRLEGKNKNLRRCIACARVSNRERAKRYRARQKAKHDHS